jgi:hypothetical protein
MLAVNPSQPDHPPARSPGEQVWRQHSHPLTPLFGAYI